MASEVMIQGKLTADSVELMRRRIGYPNPSVRRGYLTKPKNITASHDGIRQWAEGIGDANPLFNDPEYGKDTRWGEMIASPGFEVSMGLRRNAVMPPDEEAATRRALRGLQLFHSGSEHYYYRPIRAGDTLFKSDWVADVAEKNGRVAERSVLVTNNNSYWNQNDEVVTTGSSWFIHAERGRSSAAKNNSDDVVSCYTDEQLAEIERAYDNEYIRGAETLYFEDVSDHTVLPVMVKGPLTITDMINFNMAQGWGAYGNPPYRLAYENRKLLRGFYSRNEYNSWDTNQRVHWDPALTQNAGVKRIYDIGTMRFSMLCHYLSNYAGDDGWVYHLRYELRKFNYMGDTTWISGKIVKSRVDDQLGPLIELSIRGVNHRGQENITATATILLPSRATGPVRLPPPPPMTPHRS